MSEWRWVPGFEGLYQVSDDGEVRSFHRVPGGQLLRGGRDTFGYRNVVLYRRGAEKGFRVHALVALAFIGPRPEGSVVRHLDGDHDNNRVTNLAYGTQSENVADTARHGRKRLGEAHGCARLTVEQVHAIRLAYRPGVVRMADLASWHGVTRLAVRQILRGRTWRSLVTPGWRPLQGDQRKTRHQGRVAFEQEAGR